MAFSTSMGKDVERPLATVVIGGLVTSTLLTMMLPVLYQWIFKNEGVAGNGPDTGNALNLSLLHRQSQ